MYIISDFFENGLPKKILGIAFEISGTKEHQNQVALALKKINGLTYKLRNGIFTKREKEVVALIVKGETDKKIAEELFISIATVKKHRNNILRKAGVKNSAELAAIAVGNGIF